jgi:probable HAF family extracellular repeat protein
VISRRGFASVRGTLLWFTVGEPVAQSDIATITDLGTLGGTLSNAYAINNYGQVVRFASTATDVQLAFLYSGGTMSPLPGGPNRVQQFCPGY